MHGAFIIKTFYLTGLVTVKYIYLMITGSHAATIRSRIAALGIRQGALAAQLGMHETLLSAILNERRPMPVGFETRTMKAMDLLERAEAEAQKARERVLAGEGA